MSNLLWLPNHYLSNNQAKYYATWPTFEMFFGDKESNSIEDLESKLSTFNGLGLLMYLATMNLILSANDGFFWKDDREYSILISSLYDEDTAKKIEEYRQKHGRFTTLLHFWALQKATLRFCDFSPKKETKTFAENLRDIGKLFLRIGSHIGEDYIERKSAMADAEEKRKLLLLTTMRSQEVVRSRKWGHLLARYQILYKNYIPRIQPQEQYDFVSKFLQITGFSLDDFMRLGFLLYTHYADPEAFIRNDKKKSFVFKHFFSAGLKGEFQQKLFRMYPLISSDLEGYKQAFKSSKISPYSFWFDFNPIWQKPLYRISEIEMFPLDIGYLFEKFTLGTYWIVKDHLRDNKMIDENRSFNTFFGRVIEIYCDDILHRMFNPSLLLAKNYWSEQKGEVEGVDGIANSVSTLFFFEFTARDIPRIVFLNQEWASFEREKNKILFGESGEEEGRSKAKGKIGQLDKAITDFKRGALKLENISPHKTRRIIPIIIFQKCPPFAEIYWEEVYLKPILQRVENKEEFKDIQFLDLEELEVIEALTQGENSFEQLFLRKLAGEHKCNPFKVFGINELHDWPQNPHLSGKLKEFAEEAQQLFRDDTRTQQSAGGQPTQ